ncbi:MAG: hypothetical protein HZB83_08955, partial [Deltaproteobacteria bacterium]|nr:hypothetical protein [Deltaproteobacteria bacterium]
KDYLRAADLLHRNGLYTPAMSSAFFSAYHASVAAFLTGGAGKGHKNPYADFTGLLGKFNKKLDVLVSELREAKGEEDAYATLQYAENESMLRLYQTKEFLLEVEDFLRRIIKHE